MARSLKIRPSTVCLKLCDSDTLSAMLLMEILFKANITKYKQGDNLIIVYSYEEWSEITGLSVNQVRKALSRLSALNLARPFTARHPFKNVLRALHVAIPDSLWELHHCLTAGDYWYEKDILCLSRKGASKIRLSTSECAFTLSPPDTPACPQGTYQDVADINIYKNKYNDDLVPAKAEHKVEGSFSEKKEVEGEEENQNKPFELKSIPTLPILLMAVHAYYLDHHDQSAILEGKASLNAHEAGKLWNNLMEKHHSPDAVKPLEGKDFRLLKLMIEEIGEAETLKIFKGAIENWTTFIGAVAVEHTLKNKPSKPEVGFLFYFRNIAYAIYVSGQTSLLQIAQAKKLNPIQKSYGGHDYAEVSYAQMKAMFKI